MFSNGCIPIWPEKMFVNKKIKDPPPWTYVIEELFVNKNYKKIRVQKLKSDTKKDQKMYVKWKCYDNSFNS